MNSLKSPVKGNATKQCRYITSSHAAYKYSPCSTSSSSQVRHVSTRAKLGESPLFSDSTSSLLGGSITTPGQDVASKPNLDDIPLISVIGVDFTALRDHLKAGDFRQADDETRALLIKMAGEGAIKRGWVYFSEVKSIPIEDLQTMDALWKTASGGNFGYSVQRDIWNQQQKRWPKFMRQLDWVVGDNAIYRKWPAEFIYSMDAARGHLPLTNALRGTQLFEALLEHPAFEKKAGAGSKSIDELAREKAQSASKLSSGGSMF